jgi:predicted nucleic acid-binding protein
MVLGQSLAGAAQAILELASQGHFELAIPALALAETITNVERERRTRAHLYVEFETQARRQLRCEPHREAIVEAARSSLADITRNEEARLRDVLQRVLEVGRMLPSTPADLGGSLVYAQDFDLRAQDAIIYAAVIHDLQQRPPEEPKCLLDRDRHFQAVEPELEPRNCRLIGSFDGALDFIHRTWGIHA